MNAKRKHGLMLRTDIEVVHMLDRLAAKHHSTRSRMANWLLERGIEAERCNGLDAKGSEVAV
jgi:predicted transcriptional regulator